MPVAEQDVLAAMSKVIDPELRIDLVKAGMIKEVNITGNKLKLKIELTTPACPMKDQIQKDVEKALRTVPNLESFDLDWGAKVRAAPPGAAKDSLLPQVKNVVLVGAGKG